MKIVICTPVFPPSVGGLETMNMLLADSLSKNNCEVVVVTDTAYSGEDDYPYTVVRSPKPKQLLKLYKWCDIFVHSAPVVRYSWPALLFARPFVIIHHSSTFNWNGKTNFQSAWKNLLCLIAHNITVSRSVGESLGLKKYDVVNNAYDASCFNVVNHNDRSGFVYVGRLSPEKGVGLLIDAYYKYVNNGGQFHLTIVGDGSQRLELEQKVAVLGLQSQVFFTGSLNREKVATVLNENHTLVLSSTCKEAFGIVVLEAMACGCRVVGSDGDGISEAMGGNGISFKKGCVDGLEQALKQSASIEEPVDVYNMSNSEYLSHYTIEFISKQYYSLFERWA